MPSWFTLLISQSPPQTKTVKCLELSEDLWLDELCSPLISSKWITGHYKTNYLPTYVPTYLPNYIPTYLPIYLPTYLPTYLPNYLPTYLPTYVPTYLPACLATYNYWSSDWRPHHNSRCNFFSNDRRRFVTEYILREEELVTNTACSCRGWEDYLHLVLDAACDSRGKGAGDL